MAGIAVPQVQFPSSWAYSIQPNRRALASYNGDVFINGVIYGSPGFDTVADVQFAHIPAAVTAIETAGYYAVGDGGGALYIRIGAAAPGSIQSADGAYWGIADAPFLSPLQFGALADGATDDAAQLQAANDRGLPVYIDPLLTYAFGRRLQLNVPFVGGGKLLMLTGAGKFDANDYTGGYATNKTGLYIVNETNPVLDIVVEMQANAAIRTCNALTINGCTNPNIKIEAFGFKEANYGIIEANSNEGGLWHVYVHDCGADSVTLPTMQITGMAVDGNRTTGNSISPEIHGYFKNIRLGAAAGPVYGEQTDGLNIQTTGYSGARCFIYAENVGEPFDCFGDFVRADVVAKDAVNYGLKLIHGASDGIFNVTVDGCGYDLAVIGSDNNTKSCNRNIINLTGDGIGAVTNPVAPTRTCGFATDGSTATFQPTNNTVNMNVRSNNATANYVVFLESGTGNMIEVDGTLSYLTQFAFLTGAAAAANNNNRIIRRQGSHVRAYMNANNTVENGQTILWDGETYDVNNEYDPATGIFTAACAGRYRVYAQLRNPNIAAGATFGIGVRVNGSVLSRFQPVNPAAGAQELWTQISTVVDLNAGDTLFFRCFSSVAGAQAITNDTAYSFMQIDQI